MKKRICDFINLKNKSIRLILVFFSGLFSGLFITFPTFIGTVLEWMIFVPAACVAYSYSLNEKFKYSRAFWGSFLFFMTEYAVCYHWFWSMYPLDFTGMGRGAAVIVVLLGWLGLSALASFAGAFMSLLLFLFLRILNVSRRPVIISAAAASLYSIFEWFETLGWTGVPWGRLGLSQLGERISPTLMSSAILGPYFTTFLIVIVNFLIASTFFSDKKKITSLVAAFICLSNLIGGIVCLCLYSLNNTEIIKSAAVQGNFKSSEKWDETNPRRASEVYLELTKEAAENGASIILWTETAITFDPSSTNLDNNIKKICKDYSVFIAVGCFESHDGQMGNVLKFYYPDGSVSNDSYYKRHLVPFGEYVPYRNMVMKLIPPLGEISMLEYDLTPGKTTSIQNAGKVNVGSLICFDSIYEELCLESCRSDADIILLSTNDSWFGTSAALQMHLNQARLRAIENGITVLRSANTGITAAIDRTGKIVSKIPEETTGVLICDCELYEHRTVFTLIGNVFIYVCLLMISFITSISFVFYVKKRKKGL